MVLKKYLHKVDEAFKQARLFYMDFYHERDLAIARKYHGEQAAHYLHYSAAEKQEDIDRITKAEENLHNAYCKLWDDFDAQCQIWRAELEKELGTYYLVKPEEINHGVLELLKSGAMTVENYQQLETEYAKNPTMLKLIGSYAEQQAGTKDAVGENQMLAIASRCTSCGNGSLKAFDDFLTVARYCSGRGRKDRKRRFDAEVSYTLMQEWDDLSSAMFERL